MLTSGVQALLRTAQDSFWTTYHSIADPFEGLVWTRPSTQKIDTFPRLGAPPMPEEWAADVNAKVSPELLQTVTNKPFASAVKIDKELIQFQQLELIGSQTAGLGMKARAHRTKILSDLLNNGHQAAGDDGQFYFDTDHKDPGTEYQTNQDNDLTAAITNELTPTDVNMRDAIRSCIGALIGMLDDRGDPFAPPPNLSPSDIVVMVPPLYYPVANAVLKNSLLTGSVGNDMQGAFTLRVNQFLSAPAAEAVTCAFYVFNRASNHKPLGLNLVEDVSLVDNATGDDVVLSGNLTYRASWWGQGFYGQWRTGVRYQFTD